MVNIMKERMRFKQLDLVSYADAKQLRDIGFNEKCLVSYNLDKHKHIIDFEDVIKSDHIILEGVTEVRNEDLVDDFANFVAVPTEYQVMTWFRDRGYFGEIRTMGDRDSKDARYRCVIFKDGKELFDDIVTERYQIVSMFLISRLIEIYKENEC
nr:MAG TPA: hypothetical protein [Bacteriophage sp.]